MAGANRRNLVRTAHFLLFALLSWKSASVRAQTIEPTNSAPPPVSVVTQPTVITPTQGTQPTPGGIKPQDPLIVLAPTSNLPAPTGLIAVGPPPPRCMVDPAVNEVRVTKVSNQLVTIGFEIINLGPGVWESDVGQQTAVFRIKNMRTGVEFRRNFEFQTNVPAGGVIATYTSAPMADLIDPQRGAQLGLRIFYTNNSSDNRRCNDDAVLTNNRFIMEPAAFSEFMTRENGSMIGFARER